MPRLISSIFLIFFSLLLPAQGLVSIKVSDVHSDQPIQGASIWIYLESDSIYGLTGADGEMSFTLPSVAKKITVSHSSFLTQSVNPVKGQKQVLVYLTPYRLNLEEVVVTGQAKPILAEDAVRQIRVINQDRIEKQAAVNLKDLLSNDLNFSLSDDGILGTQVSLQGLSGNGVKILIDGVPVIGRLDGNIDLSQINLSDIERVEVVEGPMSILYGTDAVAGTINLITKKDATAKLNTSANAYYESAGRYNLDANVSFPIGKTQGSVSLGRNFFDGFDPDETRRNLQWNPKEQYFGSASFRRRFNRFMIAYRGEYFDEAITNLGDPGSIDSLIVPVDTGAWKYPRALDDYYYTTRINNSINADYYWDSNKQFKAFVAYNYYRREKNTQIRNLSTGEDLLSPASDAQDTSVFGMLSSRLFFNHNYKDKFSYQTGYDVSYEQNQGQRIEGGIQSITEVALFLTGDYMPTSEITIQPGLRYAYNSSFKAPIIKSLAVRWQPLEDWILRASYGEGFRAPSLKELYFYFVDENHNVLGNPDLQAETSRNYQLDLSYLHRYEQGSVESDVGLFFNDISDQIRLIAIVQPDDDDPRGLYTNMNVDRTMTAGGSWRFNYIHGPWQVESGVSYIGIKSNLAFSDEAETLGEDKFYFYPQVRTNLYYTFEKLRLQPSIFFNYTGRRTDLVLFTDNQLSQSVFDAYALADIMLKKEFYDFLSLSVGVKNIFDVTNLQSSTTLVDGAHSTGSSAVPLSYGRTLVMRIQLRL